jgi:hypothetical protein
VAMSYSARGDREHCIPITPAREKKHLRRLMKRLCALFNTSCCVCANINAAHRPSREKITLRAARNFSRRCKNPRRTRLFDDSDFLALAIVKRRP